MPGVQTLMPVMLNHINEGRLSLKQLMKLVCENPVKILELKIKDSKRRIRCRFYNS